MPLISTTINAAENTRFASLSGDFNPIHTDPVIARRLLFGKTVVHGVHLVLKTLEYFLASQYDYIKLVNLTGVFESPVGVNEIINIAWENVYDTQAVLKVSVKNDLAVEIRVQWDYSEERRYQAVSALPKVESPQRLQVREIQGRKGTVELLAERDLLQSLFPKVSQCLPVSQIAILLATTRVVGMKCPGYNSILSEISIDFKKESCQPISLDYEVVKFDSRFNLVTMALSNASALGRVRAFLRPAPVEQPSSAELEGFVDKNDFRDSRYLIVGGSRGIGEISAKLVALGGGEVRVTYFRGEDDACRVAEDIRGAGGCVGMLQYDVRDGSKALLQGLAGWQPTHLLYFATPFIFQGKRGGFSYELFQEFSLYYINKFTELFFAFRNTSTLRGVFYPSTIAIDEQPAGMAEYVAAKSAGEVLCSYLARSNPKIVFRVPRLPRVATDQTASLLHIDCVDIANLIVPNIKGMP